MRSKEDAHDYRYFPDPDLLPLIIDRAWVERARAALPDAAELLTMPLDGLGLTGARIRTLQALATALQQGLVLAEASDAQLLALPGIGPWTLAYWRLRCGDDPDAFPAGDLVLQKALLPETRLSAAALTAYAEAWRPWRAYAASWLWQAAASGRLFDFNHEVTA